MKRVAIASFLRTIVAVAAAAPFLVGCGGAAVPSVGPQSTADQAPPTVPITSAMLAQHATFTNFRYHLNPVMLPGSTPQSVIFPLDLTKGGGKVLTATTQNDVFVNTTSAAVGTPTTYQADFNLSTFISVLNQYDGVTSAGKFPVGTSFTASPVPTFSNLIDQDQLFSVIHAAAKLGGTGYGHQYNVFLAKGLDTCIDFGPCYSPDNLSAFVFCAYHASVTFTDIGHVIFAIIPYQDTLGCGDFGLSGLPNPAPVDSTATAVSHETSEAISDPDANTGWFNTTFGMEVADICSSFRTTEVLNGKSFVIQPEYSNSVHGCFF